MRKKVEEAKSEMRQQIGRLKSVLIGRLEVGNSTLIQPGDD